jgi:hypothetical protein
MKTPLGPLLAATLTRLWTRAYTVGLEPRVRDGRRREVDSDLWESLQDAHHRGERPATTTVHVLARLVIGWVDDVTWRVEHMSVRRSLHTIELVIAAVIVVAIVIGSFMYDLMRADQLPQPPTPPPMVIQRNPPPPPPAPPPPPPGRH